jgi:hypothetical protein
MLRVNQLSGFGGADSAATAGPVTFVADDGDDSLVSSAASLNLGANTGTGPYVFVGLTWSDGTNAANLSSLTWNGVAGSILEQGTDGGGGSEGTGAAIVLFEGAQAGNIVANFDNGVDVAAVTKLSVSDLSSTTPIATDTDLNAGGGGVVLAYATPTADGIAVAVVVSADDNTGIGWGAFTELSDNDTGNLHRHSMAYLLGSSTGVSPTGATTPGLGVAVSMR